jgi:geranylgeranyl pyrophosphate synthase
MHIFAANGGINKMENKALNLESFFHETYNHIEQELTDKIPDKNMRNALNGGKRLRSILAQLSFKACTQGKETHCKYKKSLEGTVSIELAHGASLVHDDIIDKDVIRRGKPAFHVKEGVGKALLMGHKMIVHGFDIALSHGKEIAKLYVDSWNEVVNGEIAEIDFNNGSKQHLSIKEQIFEAYYKIIDLKTAGLFASACKVGAMEADMAGDILKVFSDYGREIGLAYQLADDLVDLANGEMIDSVIIPLLNRLENKPKIGMIKKRELRKMFAKNQEKIKTFYLNEIKKHVSCAEELSKSNLIPESSYKKLLSEAPTNIINRMLSEIQITI